jgi:hypothetical protein
MLMLLLEYPPEAFEIYIDPVSFKESLRVRSAFLREQAKLIRSIIISFCLNDFIRIS